MYKVGVISETKPGYCKVHFPANDIVSDWLPIAYQGTMAYKDHHPYEVQQQVVCLMDENCEDGCIIGATYNDEDTPPTEANANTWVKKFKDGTTLTYNSSSKHLKVKAEGKVTIDAKDDVLVKTLKDVNCEGLNVKGKAFVKATVEAPLIELKGNVTVVGTLTAGGLTIAAMGGGSGKVNGNLEVTGEVKGATVKAGTIDLATHKHLGVTTGAGISGTPTP
jgi:phage baseplate assembly protein V